MAAKRKMRTSQSTELDALTLAIFRTNGRLLRAGDAMTKDIGLTSARWQILGAIRERPKTVAQIARDFELTRQGVLFVVQSMLKDGLVELIENPDHRRAKLVRHTDSGVELFGKIMNMQIAWTNKLGEYFSIEELATCRDIIERLSLLLDGRYSDAKPSQVKPGAISSTA